MEKIYEKCQELSIVVDKKEAPVEVTPGCFMFYGTNTNGECRYQGLCKYERYYAIFKGDSISIERY